MEAKTVRVVVDGGGAAYLGEWAIDPRVAIELLDEETGDELANAVVAQRISATFYRCLAGAPQGVPMVVCQDDVEFAEDWWQQTLIAVTKAEALRANRAQKTPYALTLYATKKLRTLDRPLAPYKAGNFFGNQALYFPADTMELLVPYFRKMRVCGMMDDMLLKHFFIDYGVVLKIVNPNPAQHIGQEGTHAGKFHSSPTFGKG